MELSNNERVDLRPITPADRPFLLKVYESSRSIELQLVDWDDETKRAFIEHQYNAQDAHYREHYPGATLDVVLAGGEPCGRFFVYRGKDQIAIMDISILSEFRGRGIGGRLIKGLLEEATSSNRSVRIFLESFNPYHLTFEKLGFKKVDDDGVSRRYEWHPSY